MTDFAHSPIHEKIQTELIKAFSHISSDEEEEVAQDEFVTGADTTGDTAGGGDDGGSSVARSFQFEQPHEKVELKGWTAAAIRSSAVERARRFSKGQSVSAVPTNNPFFRTGRLARMLLKVKHRFLLLHALSKLPRPKPEGWTDLHTVCYVHDFQHFDTVLKDNAKQRNATLQGERVDGITPLHLLVRPFARLRARHDEPAVVDLVIGAARKLLEAKADVNAKVSAWRAEL